MVSDMEERYCSNCGTPVAETTKFCPKCGAELAKIADKPQSGMVIVTVESDWTYCQTCGNRIRKTAEICPACGTRQIFDVAPTIEPERISEKDWVTTLVLAIFLGCLGIHRFYVGKIGTGILMILCTLLCGSSLIWVIIDIVFIATNKFTDQEGKIVYHKE
jgi:TM2 domain-containing membrane protein YozV/RNA polymerase subunit RPABC4/transcription elongation factor Spt4